MATDKARGAELLAELARQPLRTVGSAAVAAVSRHPRQQLARLVERGVLHRAAQGYYVVIPQEYVGTAWLPGLEAVAAGIGTVMFGTDNAIVMGVSAARMHGVMPRSLGVAVVAVPRQRATLRLVDRDASVRFVARDTGRLDAELIRTELGGALVTTSEQTVLDLTRRPDLGDAAVDVPAAIRALYRRCDRERLAELAIEQRMRATLDRVNAMVGE
ncbi:type IV toxin-antitoxin system AbiEi family antitoxin domain-containing protein [Nocardia sp. 2]|uniref:Type IV toxin-antitoxin system AbiEi family antitoxin domain-containing protein n=1 Tax=Nocardia acididurans TaxID=2802282 RepID=A0ABS1M4G0_9NOCA|nr:type IV toxin-antitoxin system AbiEi family antitoxin [Nocardia acididurans]MBL1075470.1 type IV toxin-antitoxin system AbiEi family antitoxin domain-containing protein [Nocardia acididurans]